MTTERRAGVDEAGRGPIAGPVVAGAVILPARHDLAGLTDSKRLSAARREALAVEIRAHAIAWAVATVEADEIDAVNILQASLRAMARAVDALSPGAGSIVVDGNRCPEVPVPARAVVGGDGTVPAISAASILAKVERDRQMVALAERYPAYGFDRHKGYPTAAHIEALRTHGASPVHRRSFAPVRDALAAPAPVQTRLLNR